MTTTIASALVRATTVDEATAALATPGARVLAGGTWVLRAPLRGEPPSGPLVSIAGIPGLDVLTAGATSTTLGALLTHTDLAALEGPALNGIARSAATSAFPQVRNVATLGANLANAEFPEADLVPALLAAEATVNVATVSGTAAIPVAEYVATRAGRPHGELVTSVVVPTPSGRSSGYERLTVRVSGEYAIAGVAVSLDVAGGNVTSARVAIGSIEAAPRLVPGAASALAGRPAGDPDAANAAAAALAASLTPREGKDAPGWYRAAVAPSLLRRVLAGSTSTPEDR